MSAARSDSGGNCKLTGVWEGLYSYPNGGPNVPFTATLIESGYALSGSVHEQCLMFGSPNETLLASLIGSRQGTAVNFVKTYDRSNHHYGSVVYDGTVNGDATEIEGRWTVPGDWSGRFLMIRSGNAPVVAVESESVKTGSEVVGVTPARGR
jgi:hypothetical protein